ncbi:MAG: hypothetical protein OQL27_03835 [Sedimenticola sp.]|nr:hypothetical protein [Sedimenticola sp.]
MSRLRIRVLGFSLLFMSHLSHAEFVPVPDGYYGLAWGSSRDSVIAKMGEDPGKERRREWEEMELGPYEKFRGQLRYTDVVYSTKKAVEKMSTVTFYFQEGCTSKMSKQCRLVRAQDSEKDVSQAHFDEIEAELTALFGPPTEVKRTVKDRNPGVYHYTAYIRYAKGVKIKHLQTVVKEGFKSVTGEWQEPGIVANVVDYYSPDY